MGAGARAVEPEVAQPRRTVGRADRGPRARPVLSLGDGRPCRVRLRLAWPSPAERDIAHGCGPDEGVEHEHRELVVVRRRSEYGFALGRRAGVTEPSDVVRPPCVDRAARHGRTVGDGALARHPETGRPADTRRAVRDLLLVAEQGPGVPLLPDAAALRARRQDGAPRPPSSYDRLEVGLRERDTDPPDNPQVLRIRDRNGLDLGHLRGIPRETQEARASGVAVRRGLRAFAERVGRRSHGKGEALPCCWVEQSGTIGTSCQVRVLAGWPTDQTACEPPPAGSTPMRLSPSGVWSIRADDGQRRKGLRLRFRRMRGAMGRLVAARAIPL